MIANGSTNFHFDFTSLLRRSGGKGCRGGSALLGNVQLQLRGLEHLSDVLVGVEHDERDARLVVCRDEDVLRLDPVAALTVLAGVRLP